MTKVPKWQIAADFLEKNGRISSMDIIEICNTVAPHKYLMILKQRIGLKEIQTEPYKIFVKADNQLSLNFK